MSKVHAVLLVPHEGDPHGLLKEGPFGARPPTVEVYESRCECPTHRWAGSFRRCSVCHIASGQRIGRALVLAWDGKPVPVLWDWSSDGVRVMFNCVVRVLEAALGWSAYEDDLDSGDVDVLTDHRLPGTLVLLDAEGLEVTP